MFTARILVPGLLLPLVLSACTDTTSVGPGVEESPFAGGLPGLPPDPDPNIHGTVIGSDSTGLAGLSVTTTGSGYTHFPVTTWADGTFALRHPSTDCFQTPNPETGAQPWVWVDCPGCRRAMAVCDGPAALVEYAGPEIEYAMIRGVLLDEYSNGLAGREVYASGRAITVWARTAHDGTFEIPHPVNDCKDPRDLPYSDLTMPWVSVGCPRCRVGAEAECGGAGVTLRQEV